MWIARFTPTDLHLPRRRRPPPADARTPLPAGPSRAPPRSFRQHRGPAAHPARGSREREAAGPGERLCKRIPCSASRPPPPKYCTVGEAATRRRRPDEQRTPSSSTHAEPSSSVRCALPQIQSEGGVPRSGVFGRCRISQARFVFPWRIMGGGLRRLEASVPTHCPPKRPDVLRPCSEWTEDPDVHPEATVVVSGWPSLTQGSLPNSSRLLPPVDRTQQ